MSFQSLDRLNAKKNMKSTIFDIFNREHEHSHEKVPGGCSWRQRPGEGDSHMKGAGMLVASLRGTNFGLWSHLGCSGQNAIIFSREGLVYGCARNVTVFFYLSVF